MSDISRRPQKILHVLNSAGGGAALSTIDLIKSLRKEGIAACAVCHDAGTTLERERLREATEGHLLITHLYWWNKKIRAAHWKRPLMEARQILRTGWSRYSATQVTRFAEREHADLIHTNTILTPEGGLAARWLGLPHVWHLRELLGRGQPFRLSLEGPSLGRYLSSHCSKLVANSQVCAAKVRDWLPQGLLEVVPNGIDLSRFSQQRERLTEAPIIVAMVGSLSSRWKKHALFIEAAAGVKPDLGVEFRIYGHDPSNGGQNDGDDYTNKLRELVQQHGLMSRFRWPGYLSDPARIMSEVDILVHPADNESFGRTAVEAMAACRPVIGVRGGGIGEIVVDGETGLLCEPDNPKQLAACIERLVSGSSLRSSYGLKGRGRAEKLYSLEGTALGVLRVYEAAMSLPLGLAKLETTIRSHAAAR